MTNRPILVHYHIFKNAGCSVDASLQASFGADWVEFEGSHAHDIQPATRLADFLQANPAVRAVSSHLARPPLPWEGCLPVVFLRHPLLRARSVYEFTRRDPAQPFSEVASANGFAGYIRWALRRERGSIVIRNYQVVHLSQASWRCAHVLDADAGQRDLDEAKALLTGWGVAGIVEAYALSAKTFQALYGPRMAGLDFKDRHVNATAPEPGSVEEQIEQCGKLLGTTLRDDFMASNALDMALYEHAVRVLKIAHKQRR